MRRHATSSWSIGVVGEMGLGWCGVTPQKPPGSLTLAGVMISQPFQRA